MNDIKTTLESIEGYLANKADRGDELARALRSELLKSMAAGIEVEHSDLAHEAAQRVVELDTHDMADKVFNGMGNA